MHAFILSALAALAAAAPAAHGGHYNVTDFYAGSGPKSEFTDYRFGVSVLGPKAAPASVQADPRSCSFISGTDNHNGYIASQYTTNCSSSVTDYTFSFTQATGGYYFNLTDYQGGHGSHFISQDKVTQVQNTANPGEPDPFPNYQISIPAGFKVKRHVK